LFTLGH